VNKETVEVKEHAGGWITERKGTKVPGFLKLSYVGFSLFGIVYLFLYRMGEVAHGARGAFVRELNQSMDVPPGPFIALLAACVILFVAGLLMFTFSSAATEE